MRIFLLVVFRPADFYQIHRGKSSNWLRPKLSDLFKNVVILSIVLVLELKTEMKNLVISFSIN